MTFATVPLTPSVTHSAPHRAEAPSAVELRAAAPRDVDEI
jgi:hypothetical protein